MEKNFNRCHKCSSIFDKSIDVCPSCGAKLFETRNEKVKIFFLTLFLGCFGAHKFARGEKRWGKTYLYTLGLFGLGWIYDIFFSLIDMFYAFTTSDEQRRSSNYNEEISNICKKVSTIFCASAIMGIICSPVKVNTNNNVGKSNITSSIENEENIKQESQQIEASLTATQLLDEYKNNVISAENNYKNKYIKVSGTINSIDKTLFDDVIIRFETGKSSDYICCYISDSNEINKTKSFAMGYEIVLSGKCTSSSDFLGDTVYLRDCKVISSIKKDKFTLINSSSQNLYYTYSITGTIKNNTSNTYSYVLVTFNLYDSNGNQIGTATDSINNFDANGTWKFKASKWIGDNKNVASYKLVEIKNY